MSIARSALVFSPVTTGIATVGFTAPAGTTAVLIWGFVDVASTTVGNATVARFNGVDAALVSKSMPGPLGRPIWVYKATNLSSLPLTANIEFSDGTANNKIVGAFSIQSTNALVIQGGAGTVGKGTVVSSSILTSYQSGKVYSALSANDLLTTNVTETGGQSIISEVSSAGFIYSGVDEKTPVGGNGSSTDVGWTLASIAEWGELSVSVREVTKLSQSSSDASLSGKVDTVIANIATLSALVTTDYNATITAIATQTTGQNTRFTNIDNQLTNVGSGVTSINGSLGTFITGTTTRFNTVDTNVATVKAVVDNIFTTVNGVPGTLTSINSTMVSRFNSVDTATNTIITKIDSSRVVIDSISNAITTFSAGTFSRFSTVDTSLLGLASSQATITTNLNTANVNIGTALGNIGTLGANATSNYNNIQSNISGVETNIINTLNTATTSRNTRFTTIDTNIAAVKTVVDTINAVGATTRFNSLDAAVSNVNTNVLNSQTVLSNQINTNLLNIADMRIVVDNLEAASTESADWYGSALHGWSIGETRKLAVGTTQIINPSKYSLVNRSRQFLLTPTTAPSLYTYWKNALMGAHVAHANLSSAMDDSIVGLGMGSNGVMMVACHDSSVTGSIFRCAAGSIDFSTGNSFGLGKPGNPVCKGATGTYWVIPTMGAQSLFYSTNSAVSWASALTTGLPSGFSVTSYQRMHSAGLAAIVWDGTNFVTNSGNLTYRSSDGINWAAGGAFAGSFTFMHYFKAESRLIAYGLDTAAQRCAFQYSNDSGATWTAGGYFVNGGTPILNLSEAAKYNVVFSGVDSASAVTPRWYKSGAISAGQGSTVVLFEYLTSALTGAGTSFLVTNPTRPQHFTMHAANCVSIDCDYFPVVLDKAILNPFYCSLRNFYDIIVQGFSVRDFNSGFIDAHIGKIVSTDMAQAGSGNTSSRSYRVMVMQDTNNEGEAGYVINLTLRGYLMLVFPSAYGRANSVGGAVLPAIVQPNVPGDNLFTRVY